MENDKTRGFLPQECVDIILEIYKAQNRQRHALLNEIEVFRKINSIHMRNKKCAKCGYEFLNVSDGNFLYYVNMILSFKLRNERLVNTFFKAFSGFPYQIEEVKAHDLLWSERNKCFYCKQIVCYGCTLMCTSMNYKNFICPMCNSISNIEKYYHKIDGILNNME